MNYSFKVLLILCITLLNSCGSNRIYTTGSYGAIKSYTEKPLFKGEKETATYVSGDVVFGSHEQEGDTFKDTKTLISADIHRSTSGRWYNYYYGAGLSMGAYKFERGYSSLINDGEKSKFYNFNLKSGFNINYNRPKTEWRFIGIELMYFNEFGPYQNKLNNLRNNQDTNLDVINIKSFFTYNIFSEYVFKSVRNDRGFMLGFYAGDIINYDEEVFVYDAAYNGFMFGFILKQLTISLIIESGNGGIHGTKVGVSYKL